LVSWTAVNVFSEAKVRLRLRLRLRLRVEAEVEVADFIETVVYNSSKAWKLKNML
jgi:hypothetical protein